MRSNTLVVGWDEWLRPGASCGLRMQLTPTALDPYRVCCTSEVGGEGGGVERARVSFCIGCVGWVWIGVLKDPRGQGRSGGGGCLRLAEEFFGEPRVRG